MTQSETTAANAILMKSIGARTQLANILSNEEVFAVFTPAERKTLAKCSSILLGAIKAIDEAFQMDKGLPCAEVAE